MELKQAVDFVSKFIPKVKAIDLLTCLNFSAKTHSVSAGDGNVIATAYCEDITFDAVVPGTLIKEALSFMNGTVKTRKNQSGSLLELSTKNKYVCITEFEPNLTKEAMADLIKVISAPCSVKHLKEIMTEPIGNLHTALVLASECVCTDATQTNLTGYHINEESNALISTDKFKACVCAFDTNGLENAFLQSGIEQHTTSDTHLAFITIGGVEHIVFINMSDDGKIDSCLYTPRMKSVFPQAIYTVTNDLIFNEEIKPILEFTPNNTKDLRDAVKSHQNAQPSVLVGDNPTVELTYNNGSVGLHSKIGKVGEFKQIVDCTIHTKPKESLHIPYKPDTFQALLLEGSTIQVYELRDGKYVDSYVAASLNDECVRFCASREANKE